MTLTINWSHIKRVWIEGVDNLISLAHEYGISTQDIALKAQTEGWPDRGTAQQNTSGKSASKSVSLDVPILDDRQVILAHKTDLGRMRLLAACIIEGMDGESDHGIILMKTERLIKIYAQLIPLERIAFGIDVNSGDAPDTIVISRRK